MIFETLHDSAKAGELMLIDGGYLRWHLRRDGVIVIYEIIATRPGAGWEMLSRLIDRGAAIQAKCPVRLSHSNAWWRRRGFKLIGTELTSGGTELNIWRLDLA